MPETHNTANARSGEVRVGTLEKNAAGGMPTCVPRPLVSVVIPTFNRAALLDRAIRSVLRQTYEAWEVIVVDDCSSDATGVAVSGFGDHRIKYIRHLVNLGGSAARNTGIRAACGDFIAFLDDDDEWVEEKLEEQLRALGDADAILCTASLNGRKFVKRRSKDLLELRDLRKGTFVAGGTGTLLARACVFKNVSFDEELPRCQDWDLFIRIAQGHRVRYLNKPLVKYNEGRHARISNAIVDMSVSEIEKRARILLKHRDFFGPRWFRYHLSGFLLYGIRHRRRRWRHLGYAIKRCGIFAVARTLAHRAWQRCATGL